MNDLLLGFSESYTPDFSSYVQDFAKEEACLVQSIMAQAFKKMHISERLLIKPLLELHAYKVLRTEAASKVKGAFNSILPEAAPSIEGLDREIRSRLDILNANGDLGKLVRTFVEHMVGGPGEDHLLALAKKGEMKILSFIQGLYSSGELST